MAVENVSNVFAINAAIVEVLGLDPRTTTAVITCKPDGITLETTRLIYTEEGKRLAEVLSKYRFEMTEKCVVVEKSDFGKAVADVYRGLKEEIESRPVINKDEDNGKPYIDRSVKEQVISDIDRHIEENEKS
jgi:hypothetical protein